MQAISILFKYWKQLLILVAGCALFLGGYYRGKQNSRVEIQEKIVEKIVEKEVEKKHEKRKVKTVITKQKDGTETTTIVENSETDTQKESVRLEEKKAEISTTTSPGPSYAIGARAVIDLSDPLRIPPSSYAISAGYKIWKPLWIRGDYDIKKHDISVGFDWMF
jgi:hypothetical protein